MNNDEKSEDITEDLVARIQAGEREAWSDLYNRFHDSLLLAVRCRLGPFLRTRLDSEDVLQSVVRDAIGELDGFEWRGEGSLRHFLNKLVTHKIQNHVRSLKAQKRRGEVPLTDSLYENCKTLSYRNQEVFERLETCLKKLPEEMQEVVLLRKIEGLSSQEAAEVLGKSDDAVRQLYSRALKQLTTLMTGTDT